MKKQKNKFCIRVLCVTLLTLLFTACGRGSVEEGNSAEGVMDSGDLTPENSADVLSQALFIYKDHPVHLDGVTNLGELRGVFAAFGRLYLRGEREIAGSTEGKSVRTNTYIESFVPEGDTMVRSGTHIEIGKPQTESEVYDYQFDADEEGNLFCLRSVRRGQAATDGSLDHFLVKFDAKGIPLYEVSIDARRGGEDWFPKGLCVTQEGDVLVANTDGVERYDGTDGAFLEQIHTSGDWDDVPFRMRDGEIVMVSLQGDKQYLVSLTDKHAEPVPLPSNLRDAYPGEQYDLYLVTERGVEVMNLSDAEPTLLMDFMDSDLNAEVMGLADLGNEGFYALLDEETVSYGYNIMVTSAEGSEVSGRWLSHLVPAGEAENHKEIVTLGTRFLTTDMKRAVVRFNRASDTVRIKTIDYETAIDPEDEMNGTEVMNRAIMTGNLPDIVILNDGLPVNSYFSKGAFMPLDAYLDADEGVREMQLFTNILDAFRYQGTLYQIPTGFNLQSAVVKARDVDALQPFTIPTVLALARQRGLSERDAFGDGMLTHGDVLYQAVMRSDLYFNAREQTCDFDHEAFRTVLDYAKLLYRAPDDGTEYTDKSGFYRTDQAIVSMSDITSAYGYCYLKTMMDAPFRFLGTPGKEGAAPPSATSMEMVAVSAKTDHPEACWEFVRYFLTEDYQNAMTYMLPLSETVLRRKLEAVKTGAGLTEKTYLAGEEVAMQAITDEEVELLIEEIKRVRHVAAHDQTVMEIVFEEALPYFTGQKEAEDVSRIIQSRVQLYLKEME